jgi:hypothetical protein
MWAISSLEISGIRRTGGGGTIALASSHHNPLFVRITHAGDFLTGKWEASDYSLLALMPLLVAPPLVPYCCKPQWAVKYGRYPPWKDPMGDVLYRESLGRRFSTVEMRR